MADPIQTQTYTSNIPQELLPYAQTMLDTAAQFTDIEKNPYQQYTGERVAQTSPLMQQAMDTASQMGVAGQVGAGSALAGAAGLEALTPYSFTNTGMAQQYMSPYMQNVVDVQQQQAKRQAAIANQAQQAQATQAGAFGGGRDAIMRAQANAELQRNLQGIQATGLQNAYQQGMQQYNQEQSQRMQGLGVANQAASTLGSLGQNQFAQTAGIVGLQGQLGQAEQQRAQDVLNAQYQDFLNYQNYPYKQLGFMSDLIRGVPTTTSASSIYQAPPTTMQNLMSLGLGAYGLNSLFSSPSGTTPTKAEGGVIKGYAKGGITQAYGPGGSVMSPEFKRYAVDHIDPRQLPMAQHNALARGDRETAGFATDEMALDAAIRRGIGAAFTPDMADNIVRAAGGGILAFKEDGLVDTRTEEERGYTTEGSSGAGGDFTDVQLAMLASMGGDGETVETGNRGIYADASNRALRTADEIRRLKYEGYTPEQLLGIAKERYKFAENLAGPSPYGDAQKDVAAAKTDRLAALEQGKGLSALRAASAVLRPGGTMRGLGAAGEAFADSYGKVLEADRKEKRALASMQFNITDAQRKERMGMTRDALASAAQAQKDKKDVHTAQVNKLKGIAEVEAKVAAANRPIRIGGAGGKERDQAAAMRVFSADIKRQFPDMPQEQVESMALQQFLQQKSAGLPGVEARNEATGQKEARTSFNNRLSYGVDARAKAYRDADKAGDMEKRNKIRAEIAAEEGYKLPDVPDVVTPTPIAKTEDKPAAKPAATDNPGIAAKAKESFGSYEPSKYDYRINPDTGRLQRKAK